MVAASKTSSDSAVDRLYQEKSHEEGIWVGVDFGTSNCACAVWDSAGGRSKSIRFPNYLAEPQRSGKGGRIMPSAVLFGEGDSVGDIVTEEQALVGQAAVEVVEQSSLDQGSSETNSQFSAEDVSAALVTSVKRILGMTPRQLQDDKLLLQSLPFSIAPSSPDNDELLLSIRPLNKRKDITVTPVQVTAILLRSIRQAAQSYVDREGRKKGLRVPGSGRVRNCVVGVPAHFGRAQRRLLEEACHLAGWDGHVSTVTESTAAAMAYGLFVSVPQQKSILIFDMGGGTTDVTIATMSDETFRVIATEGDRRLGGDDMDELLLQLIVKKLSAVNKGKQLAAKERRYLLRSCRRGKELLCGGADGSTEPPADSWTIVVDGTRIHVSQEEFNTVVQPLIGRARDVVQKSLNRYASATDTSTSGNSKMGEVVLVGGATRVPAVRAMLRNVFPGLELCTSINADSAVSQGAAIQAALQSGLVAKHELESALMLDALPHSIGVRMDDGSFLSILEKDTPLPAMGYATFELADMHQPGVTVEAVEDVGEDQPLEKIGEFTFLLRRLTGQEIAKLGNKRSVDIGMTLEVTGMFIVSIFDSNDPEHVEKKRRYQQHKAEGTGVKLLGYHEESAMAQKTEKWTGEEMLMVLGVVLLFFIYAGVKMAFHDPLDKSDNIP